MTVTGTPSASTRRGSSRRSHLETRLGSVEITIRSGRFLGDGGADRLERVLLTREALEPAAGCALEQRKREFERPIGVLGARGVRDQEREGAWPLVRESTHLIEQGGRGGGAVCDDQDPPSPRGLHRFPLVRDTPTSVPRQCYVKPAPQPLVR
jgi:hypothetical protein